MNVKSYIVLSLIIVMITASAAAAAADETAAASMLQDLIAKGTIIKVQAVDTISSQQNKQNEKVHFKVIEDIIVGGVTIVPANTDIEAIITTIKKAGPWGRNGQIEVAFSKIKTKDGYSMPITGIFHLRGDKQNVLVKYSLLGVFIKGKEAVIKAGEKVNLKIKEDTQISRDER